MGYTSSVLLDDLDPLRQDQTFGTASDTKQ